jgi:hypothetical protein
MGPVFTDNHIELATRLSGLSNRSSPEGCELEFLIKKKKQKQKLLVPDM